MKTLDISTKQEIIKTTSFMMLMFFLFLLTALSFISETNILFPARIGLSIFFLIITLICLEIYLIVLKIELKGDK